MPYCPSKALVPESAAAVSLAIWDGVVLRPPIEGEGQIRLLAHHTLAAFWGAPVVISGPGHPKLSDFPKGTKNHRNCFHLKSGSLG